MATPRTAWGIDIGNRALKGVKLVREGDILRIDDFEVIEHETVLSNAGDNKESIIQTALTNFVQRHPVKGESVAIGVSGQSSFARFIKLPPVEPKKIPEIVRFEAIQQIPFPLDDVEWTYQLFQDPASPDVEVGIFAMRKELVNRHIQYFSDVELRVEAVQMNPLAVYNAMFHDKRIEGTTMVVDLGAENTDLIIAEGETIWMRSIPIGGNNFTEALVKAFKLNFQKAEDLKRTAATSKYARQIFQAMRPVFADLVAEIQRSIGFYASVHRDSRIKKIIALGGTFRLPGLQKYLQQNLQLEVERIDGLGAGTPPDPKQAALFNENLLSVVGAYGLAVQAMGDGKINSSLLPLAIQRERMWSEKTKWFGTAAALFVLGSAVGFGAWYMGRAQFEGAAPARSSIQQIQSQASGYSDQWATIEQEGGPDRALIGNVKSLEGFRDTWSQMLIDIHGALPKPQWPAGDDEAMLKVPRGERNQVVLDSVISTYTTDVTNAAVAKAAEAAATGAMPGFDGMPGGMPGGMAKPSDAGQGGDGTQRGFVISLAGTTPNRQAYVLLEQQFLKQLRSIGPSPNVPRKAYKVVSANTALA
ncbi:MAG: type IV pilus assembly protein PilM, partial [Tepidisphaeraceae bacterium]